MAVFTALRNKAQSGLAGLVTGAASSALGLNRATGLRFPDSGGNRPSGDTGRLYQYPLDLGNNELGHYILFDFHSMPSTSENLNNKIDIAVHSLKDIPSDNTKGLVLKSFLKRNYPNEVLISNGNLSFKNLKRNSIVGTSSPRREFQIRLKRPDLIIKLIRGNIDTRISMLRNKNYDAIILAKAGISSLNLENLISEEFHCREIVPSAGQGIIALQAREKDYNILEILEKINHSKTEIMGKCEREVLKILGGDCNTAIGVNSKIENH